MFIMMIKTSGYSSKSVIQKQLVLNFSQFEYCFFKKEINEIPFLMEYGDEYIVFSIADNYMYDNCEMLLLPDSCWFNEKKNDIPFVERMKNIENVLKEVIKITGNVEVFVGDCDAELFEFETITIDIQDFSKKANEKLNTIDLRYIHFILRYT